MEPATLQDTIRDKAIQWEDLGVRYLHRGITKLGCDCTGLIIGIVKEMGFVKNYKLRLYPMDWNLHSGAGNYIIEELEKVAYEIPNEEVREGDILVFRFAKCLAHVGILINKDNGKFVHCFVTSRKCCYGILNNSGFGKRWEKSYRMDTTKMGGFS